MRMKERLENGIKMEQAAAETIRRWLFKSISLIPTFLRFLFFIITIKKISKYLGAQNGIQVLFYNRFNQSTHIIWL